MEQTPDTSHLIYISLSLLGRVVLAAVFGIAGIAKFFDLKGSEKAMKGFGLPDVLAKPFSIILPAIEIFIAYLLLSEFRWYGAVGALILLSLFILGMIGQIVRGNKPDCHCFGQLYSEPVGYSSLIRNILLL